MKYSTKLADALHILAFVALCRTGATSAQIAVSVQTHPSYVRQLISKLKKAGLIQVDRGKANTMLARPAEEITMRDVYAAVEGEKPLLHLDIHTNPECGVGVNIQYVIGEYYEDVQRAACAEMARVTLEDILVRYRKRAEVCGLDPLMQVRELQTAAEKEISAEDPRR